MTLRMLAGALALALFVATPAAARPAFVRVMCAGTYCAIVSVPDPHKDAPRTPRAPRAAVTDGEIVAHPAGCPLVAFCGCGASVEVFGHSVGALWLAAAWLRFPPAAPAPGMAAVRAHHVMIIREYLGDDRALVYDANSGGHRTRVHVVSLRGYRIRNPRGA